MHDLQDLYQQNFVSLSINKTSTMQLKYNEGFPRIYCTFAASAINLLSYIQAAVVERHAVLL